MVLSRHDILLMKEEHDIDVDKCHSELVKKKTKAKAKSKADFNIFLLRVYDSSFFFFLENFFFLISAILRYN